MRITESWHMLYTPLEHIPIGGWAWENGVIVLRFKKARAQVYETVTLDSLLRQICLAGERPYV